jgi:hypothetical protein
MARPISSSGRAHDRANLPLLFERPVSLLLLWAGNTDGGLLSILIFRSISLQGVRWLQVIRSHRCSVEPRGRYRRISSWEDT